MRNVLLCALVGCVLLVLPACRAPEPQGGTLPETAAFGEAITDVEIYFPSWDYIAIKKPQVTEGRFLRFMNRSEAERTLARLPVRRGVAAVVCDFYYPPEVRAQQQRDWISILSRLGFRRVVFVQKEPEEPLDHARILRDEPLRN